MIDKQRVLNLIDEEIHLQELAETFFVTTRTDKVEKIIATSINKAMLHALKKVRGKVDSLVITHRCTRIDLPLD